MKFLLLLIAVCMTALLCPPSHAQLKPPPWPLINKTTAPISGQHGTADDGNRFWGYYYLDASGFKWLPYVAVLRRDKVLVGVPEKAGEAPVDYLNRLWLANNPLPCSDTAISSICETASIELAKTPPPEPPRFIVSEKGVTGLTRPVRRFNPMTGALGTTMTKRAPVGAKCACWAYGTRSSGNAWCVWVSTAGDTRADEVTQCRAE